MSRFLPVIAALFSLVCAASAQAQTAQRTPVHITPERPVQESDIDYNNFRAEGFSGIASILQHMSPEQRRQILELAAQRQKELETLTPEERHQLELQLRGTYNNISKDTNLNTYDTRKLDVTKAKNLGGIQQDMRTYNNQRNQTPPANTAR